MNCHTLRRVKPNGKSRFSSRLFFSRELPSLSQPANSLLIIYDSHLAKKKQIRAWLRRYPHRVAVVSGENLKSLRSFGQLAERVLEILPILDTAPTIVGLGGGSVGDAVGFLASTLKRGMPLIHIPSTWLAALDSAHGGKTALNLAGYKNQIGTFYPADEVHISESLLMEQPEVRLQDVQGEVLKTALIEGGDLWKWYLSGQSQRDSDFFQKLRQLISVKNKIVSKDPFDKKNLRAVLNLGHTFGHCLEVSKNLSHGTAVYHGVFIALALGNHLGITSSKCLNQLGGMENFRDSFALLPPNKELKKLLLQDKKRTQRQELNFVFVKRPGSAVVKKMNVDFLLNGLEEVKRAF